MGRSGVHAAILSARLQIIMTPNGHPQGCRLRKGRCSIAGQAYLLTSTTCRRRPVFADQALGRVVMEAIDHHGARGQTMNFAYVVMPDHFHWLLALGEGVTLVKIMASVKGYSSRTIKKLAREYFAEGTL